MSEQKHQADLRLAQEEVTAADAAFAANPSAETLRRKTAAHEAVVIAQRRAELEEERLLSERVKAFKVIQAEHVARLNLDHEKLIAQWVENVFAAYEACSNVEKHYFSVASQNDAIVQELNAKARAMGVNFQEAVPRLPDPHSFRVAARQALQRALRERGVKEISFGSFTRLSTDTTSTYTEL